MKISVIIPVYNAEKYLAQAVQSALDQPETGEVILVEDGSRDRSLEVCKVLADANKTIRLLRHEGGRNRGVAVSRNLGISNAKYEYVAFLDADDFYLPNRFSVSRDIFINDKNVEAVYEAVGTHFESDEAREFWKETGGPLITTVKAGIPSESLFEEQSPIGSAGHCHLNGLTVKRNVFDKTGLFDNIPRGADDTAFFIKLSVCATILIGHVAVPVATRRVHSSNNFTREVSKHDLWYGSVNMWLTVLKWFEDNNISESRRQLIVKKIVWNCHSLVSPELSRFRKVLVYLRRYFFILLKDPKLIRERAFVKEIIKHLSSLPA